MDPLDRYATDLCMMNDKYGKRILMDLIRRVDEMEQRQQPIRAIGYHVGPNSTSLELAFPKSNFKGGY